MSQFSGKMTDGGTKSQLCVKNKGVMRIRKALKRQEAEERNANTPPERRRQYRLRNQ